MRVGSGSAFIGLLQVFIPPRERDEIGGQMHTTRADRGGEQRVPCVQQGWSWAWGHGPWRTVSTENICALLTMASSSGAWQRGTPLSTPRLTRLAPVSCSPPMNLPSWHPQGISGHGNAMHTLTQLTLIPPSLRHVHTLTPLPSDDHRKRGMCFP